MTSTDLAATAPLPFARRVRDTFVAPGPLFASLRAAAPWFDVLLVSTAVAVLLAGTTPEEAFLEQAQDAVSRRGEPVEITSPPAEIVRWGRMLAMLSAVVGHPILAFALAGLLSLVFSVLGPGRATFREYLSVVSHALLVYALGGLVALAVRLATDGAVSEISLAPDAASLAGRVLGAINPFTLWLLALLALGVDRLDDRLSWARASVVLFGLYLVLAVALGLQTGT